MASYEEIQDYIRREIQFRERELANLRAMLDKGSKGAKAGSHTPAQRKTRTQVLNYKYGSRSLDGLTQEKVLALIETQPGKYGKQLADALGVTEASKKTPLYSILAQLRERGLVRTEEKRLPQGRPVALYYPLPKEDEVA